MDAAITNPSDASIHVHFTSCSVAPIGKTGASTSRALHELRTLQSLPPFPSRKGYRWDDLTGQCVQRP